MHAARPQYMLQQITAVDVDVNKNHYRGTLYIPSLILCIKYTGWCDNDANVCTPKIGLRRTP
jgi:hypothetical protein